MSADPRCCGSGTCIINSAGECWCGQRWDVEKMYQPYFINESVLKIDAATGDLVNNQN
jgi:hypothetical protein